MVQVKQSNLQLYERSDVVLHSMSKAYLAYILHEPNELAPMRRLMSLAQGKRNALLLKD